MFFYTGFKVFEITKTKSGLYHAELGNGKAVETPSIKSMKEILSAFEKISRT